MQDDGSKNTLSTSPVASSDAITTFLNRPQAMSSSAWVAMPRFSFGVWANCGSRSEARTMGPATRWGKNDIISMTSSSDLAGGHLAAMDVDHIADGLEGEEASIPTGSTMLIKRQVALPVGHVLQRHGRAGSVKKL